MIGLDGAMRFASSPLGMAVIAIVIIGGAYGLGQKRGFDRGEAAQIEKQEEADAAEIAEQEGRIRDVLEDLGLDASDDDIDRVLQQLSGAERDGEDGGDLRTDP